MIERSTDPGAVESRERLLDAAEALFSELGIDAPSARAIALAAGHANTAAVGYHFGDRRGLMSALVARWTNQIDEQRDAVVAELGLHPPVAPEDAMRAVLRPWVEMLRTSDGHRRVRLLNQLTHHPMYSALVLPEFATGVARASPYIIPLAAHLDPAARRFRARVTMLTAVTMLGLYSALWAEDDPNTVLPDESALLDEMVGTLIAVLSAP